MAQTERAILLASAIATTKRGFLAIMRASQDPLGAPLRRGAVARHIDATTAPTGLASGGILDDLGDVAYAHGPYRIGG